jgi:hypothetical protein
VARQILCAAILIVCLGVSVFSAEACAQSPAPHPQASDSADRTIDVTGQSFVFDLDGPWRFHAGDDPHFADPAYDDSAWPSIRPVQPFKTVGIPSLPAGYFWTRIHLRVPTTAGRLAIAVFPYYVAIQNEIFVNGSTIASTPGMATRTLRYGRPSPVALPQTGDIVLAIRFYSGPFTSDPLPFRRVSIGSYGAIQTASESDHVRAFTRRLLANDLSIGITLLIAITAIILYRSQRDHDEYLWLGISCLDFALYASLETAILSGWLPDKLQVSMLDHWAGWICIALNVEFVMRFTRIRRRWPMRMLQGLILIGPVLLVSPATQVLAMWTFIFVWAAVAVVETACFVSAYRRGMSDAGLLLVPCVACIVLDLAWAAALSFPSAVPWGSIIFLGPVGIAGNYFANISFDLGIAAVVLYRFIRVARDEERAAAELEAARTVQQILVPEEVPSIPGFSIQAVYHPAGEVGGDFYQVLPSPNGGLLAVIGDVSGKGMPAAMTVSLLVGTVRTLAHYTHDPAGILTAMNQRLIGRGSGFTTALVLRLDPDGTLTAANAGHISPYANGNELAIDNGLPLGITADAAYINSTLHLEADTALTLLTDGVVEAQNARGELFGFDRAAEISSRTAQNVAEAARAFGQEDDITVLSLALVAAG